MFHLGVLAAYSLTEQQSYLDATLAWCEERGWSVGPRALNADDLAAAQVYLEVDRLTDGDADLGPTVEAFEVVLAESMAGRDLWTWCDALFMAPPAMAALSAETGDPRYADAMDDMWWDVVACLYDTSHALFYRDERQRERARLDLEKWESTVSENPELLRPQPLPRFWARGNAWVMAGTVRVLDRLPEGHKSRQRYRDLLRDMSESVVAVQRRDGLWGPELLQWRDELGPDSSASALFCYAMAWGLRVGVLPEETFGPAVAAAWAGLEGCIDDTGRLGWVQQIASAPGGVAADHHADYGAGAFLLAAEEVARLARP